MTKHIDVTFLQEQTASSHQGANVAHKFAELVGKAKRSVHMAVYHFAFHDPKLKTPVFQALRAAAKDGIEVQIAYYDEKSHGSKDVRTFGAVSNPVGTVVFLRELVDGTDIGLKAVKGSHLLHDKFAVVDAGTPHAQVWMGSTNFTDGAWKFMENNIVVVTDEEVAGVYESVFRELWESGNILQTGGGTDTPVEIDSAKVSALLSPKDGTIIESRIAEVIGRANHRVKVASMVLSSETILTALAAASKKHGVDFGGIYDGPETTSALEHAHTSSPELFASIRSKLVGKHSKPYNPKAPDADYDYMHNKIVVSDDVVVTGSFNFSKNATMNAENVLVIESKGLADQFASYIDEIAERYRK